MKILIISIGTRGDVEPFLAVGKILQDEGHDVYCAVPEQYGQHVLDSNLGFLSLGPEFMEIVHDPDGRRVLEGGGSWISRGFSLVRHVQKHRKNHENLLRLQCEYADRIQPDRILFSGLAYCPYIWEFQHKYKSILLLPVPNILYPSEQYSHIIFNSDWGPTLNKFSYSINNYILAMEINRSAKILRAPIPHSTRYISRKLLSLKTIYTISPSLSPPVPFPWAKILGYYGRDKSTSWKPPEDLVRFIEKNKKPLLITFGSMVNRNPLRYTRIIINTLKKFNIPAIINTAAGGLARIHGTNTDLIHYVSEIPYDWILPKVYGIIHHGGSGTLHTGLKHGCATLVIPHLFDQFMWNSIVSRNGLGPKGIKLSKISEKKLSPIILDLYRNPAYKDNALRISAQMKSENQKSELVRFIIEEDALGDLPGQTGTD